MIDYPDGALSPELQNTLREKKAEIVAYLLNLETSHVQVKPIPRADRNRLIPASSSQRGLWFQYQLEGKTSTYNLICPYHIKGKLDISALEKSIQYLIARHESLRMSFSAKDGELYLVISDSVEWKLDSRHVSGLTAERELSEEANRPFLLDKAPLFRAHLWTDDKLNHVLLLNFHHIVFDGWSQGIFERELSRVYTSIISGEDPDLPPLELDFADYASWQQASLKGDGFAPGLEYWKKALDGAPELLDLPSDHSRPAVQTYRGNQVQLDLSKELADHLSVLANHEKITLFMVMIAGYAILLNRYSRQDDIVIGIPMANRPRKELEDILGYFVNTLPLRLDLSGNPNLSELLTRVRQSALDAYQWQAIPFETLVPELNLHRDPKYSPVFQTLFSMDNLSNREMHLGDCTALPTFPERHIAKFDLSLGVETLQGKLQLELEYNTDLFDASTIQRMLEHYQRVLEWMVSNPENSVHEFIILSNQECEHILVEMNSTSTDYPREKCVHQLFEDQVERAPGAQAIIFRDQQLTYLDVNEKANQIAHSLRKLGAGPDIPVGLYLERSADLVISILGILKAGSPYVPFDSIYPEKRISEIIQDLGTHILITQTSLAKEQLPTGLKLLTVDGMSDFMSFESKSNSENIIKSDNLAYIIYTSGSTGKPKGVEITHRSLINSILSTNQRVGLSTEDMSLLVTTPVFDQSVFDILGPLCCGGTVVIASEQEIFDSNLLMNLIMDWPITWMDATPAHWRMLQNAGWQGKPGLKILCGGEAFSPDLAEWLMQTCGEVYNLYGPTEATIQCTSKRLTPGQPITVGRPIANTSLFILDLHLNPVPFGVSGELYIGGIGLARGYHNRPELTAEKFIENPFKEVPGDKIYASGDLARLLRNGEIEILGRVDNQVKIRGYRIELGEIEAALVQIPGIDQAIVLAVDDKVNAGNKRLVGYINPFSPMDFNLSNEHKFNGNEIRENLRDKLPAFMIPSGFVVLDSFPLTVNGKIDRKALLKLDAREEQVQYVAPENALEKQLVLIWEETIGLTKISVEDHFFELGGNSLLAARLLTRVREETGRSTAFASLLENDTIRKLAKVIQSEENKDAKKLLIPRADRSKPIPASSSQRGLWFQYQLEGKSLTYNIRMKYTIRGELDFHALEKAFLYLIYRHESLRMSFHALDGEPYIEVADKVDWALDIHDLISETDEREISDVANEPFELENPPLFRAHLWSRKNSTHILLLNFHHIIFDGWSWGIFQSELSNVYAQIAAGEEPYLPPLELDYADYAFWQQASLKNFEYEKGLAFWKKTLDGAPEFLELPTDHPRPSTQSFRGNRVNMDLGLIKAEALRTLANREKITFFMVMCAAYAVLLARYSRQEDIIIGIPMANRSSKGLENILGYFVNTMPLRLDLSNHPKVSQLLEKVRQASLDTYEWQSTPFENLVNEYSPHRDLKYSPIYQTMFSIDDFKIQEFRLGECNLVPAPIISPVAKYDLSLNVELNEEKLHLELEYNTDLFEQSTAMRLLAHYQKIIGWMVSEPTESIYDFNFLSDSEREQILIEFNDSSQVFPLNKNFPILFEEQVEQTPNLPAVVFKKQKLNYREVNERANRIAHSLRKLGAGPEVPVGLYLERSDDLVISILGIMKAGSPYVPIDPIFPEDRRNEIIQDLGMKLLVTQSSLSKNDYPPNLTIIKIDEIVASASFENTLNPENNITSENLAYIIYTSGSTGKPKGVEIKHRSLINSLLSTNQRTGLSKNDLSLLVTTPVFDQSVFDILGPLCCGGTLAVATEEEIYDSTLLAKRIMELPLTWMDATPAHWRMLQLGGWQGKPGLKILCGGEAFSPDLAEWLMQTCGEVYNLYGPTEATIQCTSTRLTPGQPITIGKPIANTKVYILDERLNPVPVGVIGELYIAGEGLARGYHNRPDLTDEKFIPNPLSGIPGDRMYASGDLARFHHNGDIEILGRVDDQVKIRGYRIELGEIEAALKRIPEVDQAIVLLKEDLQGDKHLTGFISTSMEKNLEVTKIRNFLLEILPAYMVPSAFVFLQTFPLTTNGKLDRKVLLGLESTTEQDQYQPPGNNTEEKLVSIWQELLGYKRIGINDDFFELGGHSLLAVRLFSEIEEFSRIKLPLAILFQYPTIRGLAKCINAGGFTNIRSSLVAIKPEGKKPPFFIVHGVGGGALYYRNIAKYLDADQPFYGLQSRGFQPGIISTEYHRRDGRPLSERNS